MDSLPPSRAERLRLQQFLPVHEQHSREQLGLMVDISITGMMLIATQELPVGRIFEIEIRPPARHPVGAIKLAAESVWCRNSPNNPRHFGVGFRFSEPAPETLAQLEHLMQEAGTRH